MIEDEEVNLLLPDLFQVDNLDAPPDDSKFVLFVGGKKVGSVGNFVTITGKPKTRKSAFAHAIISSALIGRECLQFGVRLPDGKKDIILLDTEMDKNDILASMQRIKNQSEIDGFKYHTNFKVYSVSTLDPGDILKFINNVFKKNKNIGLFIIDGLLDLINDMNDVKESRQVLSHLKTWSIENQCLFITILHQAKSTGFSIGHLGSFADRKAQAVLSVDKEKDENISTLTGQYLRSDSNFVPVSIIYDRENRRYINEGNIF